MCNPSVACDVLIQVKIIERDDKKKTKKAKKKDEISNAFMIFC